MGLSRAAAPLLLVLPLALSACGGAQTTPITVTVQSFRYLPGTIELSSQRAVRLTVKNPDTVEHDFIVDGLPMHTGAGSHTAGMAGMDHGGEGLHIHTPPGGDSFAVFTPLEKGTYTVYCSVPGHQEAGMTGTLVVR